MYNRILSIVPTLIQIHQYYYRGPRFYSGSHFLYAICFALNVTNILIKITAYAFFYRASACSHVPFISPPISSFSHKRISKDLQNPQTRQPLPLELTCIFPELLCIRVLYAASCGNGGCTSNLCLLSRIPWPMNLPIALLNYPCSVTFDIRCLIIPKRRL